MTRPATVLLLILISTALGAQTERWIVESGDATDLADGSSWMAESAWLLVRTDLAQLGGLTVLSRQAVRPDIATLELTRLATAEGKTRVTLGKYARARGLIEVRLSGKPEPTLVLRVIDLRKPDREETFSAKVSAATLEASAARLAIEAATFLGRTPSDAERPRMSRRDFRNAQALRAVGEGLAMDEARVRVARFTQATRMSPRSPLTWYLLARELHDGGKLLEAISAYRRAISLDGEAKAFHYDLANAFFDDKRYVEAAAEYVRAIALDARHAPGHENLMRALEAQKLKPDEVLAKYKEATAAHENVAVTQTQLGLLLNRKGDLKAALGAFQRAAELSSSDPIAHFNVAHVLDRMKRTDAAITAYEKALALAPNYAKAHNNLGFLYEQQGKKGPALFHYQRATKFAPDYALAWNNLAILYEQRHRYRLAISAYERVVKLTPKDPIAHYNLAVAHHKNTDYEAAIARYKKALSLKDTDKLTHWHLAAAYERVGMWNLANKHWKRVLELSPTSKEKATAQKHIAENERR